MSAFLTRGDDCFNKARDFFRTASGITSKAGKVNFIGTSSWLSGQGVSNAGERSFYFFVKGELATANA